MAGRNENRSVGLLLTLIVLVCSCACEEDHPAINGKLSRNFYGKTSCPNVEKIVRKAVQLKIQQTFVTIPGTLRLFFHDCITNGCDASLMIQSTPENKAEKDHPDNLSLAGDGFDAINKAKQAIEATPGCRNLVSCADILAIATRDVVNLAGGPFWPVELGRRDSLVSRASDVNGRLPAPTFNLNQLITFFARKGLSMTDIIALSAAHTLGFSHCDRFVNRVYNFPSKNRIDPTLNPQYASALKEMCPANVDLRIAINMDPTTPRTFYNVYYKNLIQRLGLFTSDQVLFDDRSSKPFVQLWAQNSTSFNQAFAQAMIKLGRVGVLTGNQGNIRAQCDVFN